MKKIWTQSKAILICLPILLGILLGCEDTTQKTGTLLDFVPENTSTVFKIADIKTLQEDIQNNSLLSEFSNTSPYLFFSENATLLKHLHPTSESLLCINKLTDSTSAYTFITKQTKGLFETDTLKNKSIETIAFGKKSFQRVRIDEKTAYTAVMDSVFIASSSQEILKRVLSGKTESDITFKKIYKLPNSGEFTILLRGEEVAINDSVKVDFASWSAMDLTITPESLSANGITLATDSIPQLLNVFEGQLPQQNEIAKITPIDALGALSFTFNDSEKILQKLSEFQTQKETATPSGIFGSINEVGTISTVKETSTVINSIDVTLTDDALARYKTLHSNFREVEISSFSEPLLFQKNFAPIISTEAANFVFQLDNFFVFTETEATAEWFITAYKNNSTLINTPYFEDTASRLSSASSLLFIKMQGNFSSSVSSFFNQKISSEFEKLSFDKFPLGVLQFSFDRNFAHTTFICKEANSTTLASTGTVSEILKLKLDNAVMGNPQFFTNHRSGGSNIVAQDINNTLYFISESGKTLWTKKLNSPVLGSINEIDIYGNGRKQLAFTTNNTFYILDRNGKNVSAFPKKFKDEITQPLSVFDYDSKHNYRFVITQGKTVLMLDKHGKTVKGFGFKKAKSNIVLSPKHIRMGNKDYILIAEENGKLNILSRVGRSRISVAKNFQFSKIPLAKEGNTFVVITKEHTKERISVRGKVSSQKLDVAGNYWFAISGRAKTTLDDNLLRINGKLAELPLGLYSRPQLFKVARKTYISITETQENKVYVFNENGKLLSGFPVYGSTLASLGKGNSKGQVLLAVKGETDTILIYQL